MALAMDATDEIGISLCRARQPQRGQRDTREAEAEFLERPAAGDGLGQTLGQFIEFVVHNFRIVLVFCIHPLATGKGPKRLQEIGSSWKTEI